MRRVGVVDTTFARADLATAAITALQEHATHVRVVRRTVPGIKDLPVACKKLIEEEGAELVLALGMPGPNPIDKQCAHEATLGLQQVQLATNTHILEVFVHADEESDERKLRALALGRAREHGINAYRLLFRPAELTKLAGSGQREGHADAGPLAGG